MESSQLKMSQFKQKDEHALGNINAPKKKQQIVVKERKDSGCILKDQDKVLQNIYQNQSSQKFLQGLSDMKFWRILFLGISLAEFSIQTSVILIQYISSKIGVALFITLISITLTFAIFLIVALKMLSIQKISQFSKVSPQTQMQKHKNFKQAEIITPTIAKIRISLQSRTYQKTQKLKAVNGKFPKQGGNTQTLKRLKNILSQDPIKQNKSIVSALSITTNLYFIAVTKAVQKLFSLTICTLCMCTIQNPVKNGVNYITFMITFFYILTFFSSASLICLSLKIKNKVLNPVIKSQDNKIVINENNNCQIIANQDNLLQQKMDTVLSIDKYIANSKDERSSEKKEAKSIENIIKDDEMSENVNTPSNQATEKQLSELKSQKKYPAQSQIQPNQQNYDKQKKILKKSMLKSTSHYITKLQATKDQEKENYIRMQRRKVEINSKKIQYFEYANISPANSERYSEQEQKSYSKTIYEKSKIYSQRSRYQQHKIINEDKLLQRKKQQNAKRSLCKSVKLFTQKSYKDKSFREEPSIFQQYFS